jgi:two-component system, cell cycle sensor histidine kinase and response regulator CckA
MIEPPSDTPGILVIDDEPTLLDLLEMVFRRRGFRVWCASSGEAAVALYEAHQADIDVVLLDVCMPCLDGPATLAKLRHLSPGVRACFMSGYAGRYSVDDLFAMGAARFFDKPFQIVPMSEELWTLAQGGRRLTA